MFTGKIEIGEDPAATLGNREDSEENEMEEMLEELFAAIMTVTDPAGKYRVTHYRSLLFKL